jgi:hypothetical protein
VRLSLREEGLKKGVRHRRGGWCEFACLFVVSSRFILSFSVSPKSPSLPFTIPAQKKVRRERGRKNVSGRTEFGQFWARGGRTQQYKRKHIRRLRTLQRRPHRRLVEVG